MMAKLRLYLAGGIVAGLALLAWTVRAWWRRRHRESALLELKLASERYGAAQGGDVGAAIRELEAAQAADRLARVALQEADAEVAKRTRKEITPESVEERMEGRP